jgi:UDP-N-acetyl-D-mannosaminuronic acid dehydrogenase
MQLYHYPLIRQDNLLIIESLLSVATEKMAALLRENGINTDDIQIAFSSERVVPGQTIRELMQNDRVVGGITTEAALHVALFYESFVQGEVIITNSRTAEMSKLAENACRDVNIAFANELSFLCARAGVDVWELISLANRHPRINILKPGSGVGGHCVGIDPWFIVADFKEDALIMRTAREINGAKPKWVADQVKEAAKQFKEKNNKVPKIACMGLAYKPDIDDLRESPSLIIARQLIAEGLDIIISEPNLEEHKSLKLTEYQKAVNEADIIVFLVAHKEFRSVKVPEGKPVLDICGVRSKFVK